MHGLPVRVFVLLCVQASVSWSWSPASWALARPVVLWETWPPGT